MIYLLATHVVCISATFIVVIFADIMAYEWLRGLRDTIPKRTVRILHRVVLAGLSGIIGSGLLLALPRIGHLVHEPAFLLKMGAVAALIVNALSIEKLSADAVSHPFNALPLEKRKWFYLSGFVSVFGWIGAIACGLWLTY